ncbi:glycosyltransferase [Halobellus sp. GM3]|uniref:glycosyltransferase n=1 Tax=Halobellus sp. GM3 TaxID=3458410 RepID=UPI00403E3228
MTDRPPSEPTGSDVAATVPAGTDVDATEPTGSDVAAPKLQSEPADRYRLREGVRLLGDVLISTRPLTATRVNDAAVAVVDALDDYRGAFRDVSSLSRATGAKPTAVATLCERLHDRGLLAWRPGRDPAFRPPVSVVVTVCDDRENLVACLDALAALRYSSVEVVLVDDGSTDGTPEAAARHRLAREGRLRVVSVGSPSEPLGIGASRNRGVEAASNEIVAFTDADCRPRPRWLADLIPYLAGAHVVGGRIRPAGSDAASAYEAENSSLDMGPYASRVDPAGATPYLATANVVGRRGVFEAVPFPDRNVAEDVDVCWRAIDAGYDVVYVPTGTVEHAYRTGLGSFAARRTAYGASEALLARTYGPDGGVGGGKQRSDRSQGSEKGPGSDRRQPDRVGVSTALVAVVALAVVGAATSAWTPILGSVVAVLGVAAVVGGRRRWRQYRRLAPAVTAGDVARSWARERLSSAYSLSREITRYYALPLALLGALGVASGRLQSIEGADAVGAALLAALAVAAALPLAVEYRISAPDTSFVAYAAYYLADHVGYQRGVYRGALAHRTVAHLRPDSRFRLVGFGAAAVTGALAATANAVSAAANALTAVRSP